MFLDTQVYRGFGHNPANPALKILKGHVEAHRLVLHTSDITLLEVRRQIRELAASRHQELAKLEKELNRWRRSAVRWAPSAAVTFDPNRLAEELFAQFSAFLVVECGAQNHSALNVSPATVFKRYFAREAPFDGHDSKEFPDGFVLEALGSWCATRQERMYVVTEDRAMGRAVEASDGLIFIRDVHELLARVGADFGVKGEEAADQALHSSDFDQSFEVALDEQMGEVIFLYVGDLAEGEAYQGSLSQVNAVTGWSVVWLGDERVSLILDVTARVSVEVQYEDRSDAIYDKEDDVWFGAETASIDVENDVEFEVFVDLEQGSGLVRECRILNNEVAIAEVYERYK